MFRRRDRQSVETERDRDLPTARDERVVERAPANRTDVVREEPYGGAPTRREDYVERPTYEDESVVTEHGYWFDSLAGRVNSVLFALILALESLLGLRFFLAMFGANRSSGFVDGVYDWSHPFIRPFNSAFSNRTWDQGIIEVNTLLAMAVYFLVFALLALLVNAALPHADDTGRSRTQRRHIMQS